ncbi:MAG: hypothetical protein V6Z89_21500 [Desulfobacter sp.]
MRITLLIFCLVVLPFFNAIAAEDDYSRYEAGFKNFLTCELTRTDAVDHFNGKEFKITMINLHGVQQESGIAILTGAIQCFAGEEYKTLYAAIGVKSLEGRDVVSYYTIRDARFSILATELIRFPYMERCPWSRYWVGLD